MPLQPLLGPTRSRHLPGFKDRRQSGCSGFFLRGRSEARVLGQIGKRDAQICRELCVPNLVISEAFIAGAYHRPSIPWITLENALVGTGLVSLAPQAFRPGVMELSRPHHARVEPCDITRWLLVAPSPNPKGGLGVAVKQHCFSCAPSVCSQPGWPSGLRVLSEPEVTGPGHSSPQSDAWEDQEREISKSHLVPGTVTSLQMGMTDC